MLTAKQIEERRSVVGGSDWYKLLRGSWFELWQEKTGRSDGFAGSDDTTWGDLAEEPLAGHYAERFDAKVRLYKPMVRHPKLPMGVHVDRYATRPDRKGRGILEIKSPKSDRGFYKGGDWGPDGSLIIPIHIRYQIEAQMWCSEAGGTEWADVYVGFRAARPAFRCYGPFEPSQKMRDLMAETVTRFWEYVKNDTPPPIQEGEEQDLWQEVTDVVLDATEQDRKMVAVWQAIKGGQKSLDEREGKVKSYFGRRLETARAISDNNGTLVQRIKVGDRKPYVRLMDTGDSDD